MSIMSDDEPSVWAEPVTCQRLSTLTVTLCVGDSNSLTSFMTSETSYLLKDIARDLAVWVKEFIDGSESMDEWKGFLATLRSELLDDVWNAYDPERAISVASRDSVGDLLLGASIFWQFASEVGLTTETEGNEWASLWFGFISDAILRQHLGVTPGEIDVAAPIEKGETEGMEW